MINRRELLKGGLLLGGAAAIVGGVTGCSTSLATSGGSKESQDKAKNYDISDTLECDVLVAGTGSTGIAAATRAAELGAKVLCLEKLSEEGLGGTSCLSDGTFAIGSYIQKAQGDTYTTDECFVATMDYHSNSCNAHLVRKLIDKSAEVIDWEVSQGVEFFDMAVGGMFNTFHQYKGEGLGCTKNAINQLYSQALKYGAEFLFETPLVDVEFEDGKVVAAIAKQKDGYIRINTPVVFLATGGYASSPEIFEEYTDIIYDELMTFGLDGRDGDGIKVGMDAGAALHHLATVNYCNPSLKGESEGSYVNNCGINQPTCVWVNQDGVRFVGEHSIFDWTLNANAITLQQKFFSIIDSAAVERYKTTGPINGVPLKVFEGEPVENIEELIAEKMGADPTSCFKADTVEELAEQLGLDGATLKQTIDEYNSAVESGTDPYGKPAEYLMSIAQPPFYGFSPKLAFFNTAGGLKVDEHARVLSKSSFEPIPGLYAGGSDAGGIFGNNYDVVVAAGTMQAWCTASGLYAAEHAVTEYLKS